MVTLAEGRKKGSGRKAGTLGKITMEIRTACAKHGPAMVKNLYDLAINSASDPARVAATKELLDRGFGKSTQPVEHSGELIKYVEIHRHSSASAWDQDGD